MHFQLHIRGRIDGHPAAYLAQPVPLALVERDLRP